MAQDRGTIVTKVCEATEKEGKIYLNGWFRTSLIGFAGLMITVLTILTSRVIANDEKYMDKIGDNQTSIARLEAQFNSIDKGLDEIKDLLGRKFP